ncbi:uncharacterized protein LOC131606207 [Vicia villosa]|uniref:uncharacterized protein LOC131606207 n=1 Tax=Vicia villosa TaxID=3911 RepID=UPI00273BE11A|nr:uncharacterized protein LOC131606207 [Vicia villosa]
MKSRKIDSFFKRKERDDESLTSISEPQRVLQNPRIEENVSRVCPDDIENSLECDPGKHPPMWKYLLNQMNEIRRAYLKWGPYQMHLEQYPLSGNKDHQRRFQYTWFSLFPSWLEYSPSEDDVYCLPCYLFSKRPSGRPASYVFISTGFRGWKKVKTGKHCAFLKHIGSDPCSPHNNAMKACQDLLNQNGHIRNIFQAQSSTEIMKNRLRLKTSIDTVHWLTFQACAFRGRDESKESLNQGNFLQLVKLLACYNDEVAKVVLENAPSNSKYTSHKIQKEILHILSSRVKKYIREEIGDSKFCIVVDEARDESKKEQMSLVLIFVDKEGFIQERFFGLARVNDTTSLTLKQKVCDILSLHSLDVSNIRGQGYDGARNMRGEWNVTASREVKPIHQFFDKVTLVVNVVCSSTKRHDELQASQLDEIEHLLEIGEIVTGKGENQIGLNYASRGDADSAYNYLKSFDFIFILHLMKEIMGVTNMLCQALQQQSQDVVNDINLVCSTKTLIQELREDGWNKLFTCVKSFCEKHDIEIPDLDDVHSTTRFEHYFRVEIFFTTIDKQLQELNSRFSEQAIGLLTLSCALSPKDNYKAFNFDTICTLVEKYYPMDFNEQERINLQFQLRHFIIDARQASSLKNLSTIQNLCSYLVATGKNGIYYLIDRLFRLVMTLPISTATTERFFSAMKIIKTRLRSKMEAGFLGDSMTVNIEREIAANIDSETIIDDFKPLKNRSALL